MQPGVGHAVQRDATGQREVLLTGLAMQPRGQFEQHVLEPALDARGEVGMVRAGRTRGHRGCELRPVHGFGAETAIPGGVHEFAEPIEEPRGAVGGESHHLVFVARPGESEMFGEVLVHQPERVRQLLGGQFHELAVPVFPGQIGLTLSAAVGHQHRRIARRGRERGGRGMRQMMPHETHDRWIEAGQCGREKRGCAESVIGSGIFAFLIETAERMVDQARVIGIAHRVELLGTQSRSFQAPRGRLLGELPRGERHRPLAVLTPSEPLFLGRRDDFAVHDQGRSRIMKYRVYSENAHGPPFCSRRGTCRSTR